MKNIIFMKPNWNGTGLANQMFMIIATIIRANQQNKKIVVFDNFLLEPMTSNFHPLSKIINFEHLNTIIKKYDVMVFDKHFIDFSIQPVKYGYGTEIFDITNYI